MTKKDNNKTNHIREAVAPQKKKKKDDKDTKKNDAAVDWKAMRREFRKTRQDWRRTQRMLRMLPRLKHFFTCCWRS
jgi:hypothetical protein